MARAIVRPTLGHRLIITVVNSPQERSYRSNNVDRRVRSVQAIGGERDVDKRIHGSVDDCVTDSFGDVTYLHSTVRGLDGARLQGE